ncbi:MAG TPA: SDR family NAD(P)-dependent oxidoreductase [Trueperaceae bacterium]|nr:SDR family NAD(P)-dependent oxidoreductase [Trueperaceae bacterium]
MTRHPVTDPGPPNGAPGGRPGELVERVRWAERSVGGKAVLVTGAAGGIGAAIARHLASLGARVAALDRQPCLDVPAELCLEADVAEPEQVAAAVARAERALGPVAALVSNAAVTDVRHHRVTDLPLATWDEVFRVNVRGSVVVAQAVLPGMLRRRAGNLVFVTSSLGQPRGGIPGDAVYSASKAAVEMLAWVLARESRDRGINVNTVYPSVKVDTGFFAHLSAAERRELAPPTLLDETAAFLVGLRPGTVTGVSLSQQLWDDDPAYVTEMLDRAGHGEETADRRAEP